MKKRKTRKAKRKSLCISNSIMPDRSALTERFAKFMAEYHADKLHEENIKEYPKSFHDPTFVPVEKVFDAIAKALCADNLDMIPEIMQRIYKTANMVED